MNMADGTVANAADALKRISDMVTVLRMHQDEVAEAERVLAEKMSALHRVEQIDFPELMQECDLRKVTLSDGTTLELIDDVHCSISKERRVDAHLWLRANGFGGLIKTALTIPFGRDEEAEMRAVEIIVLGTGHTPERFEAVHPQTLKAFVREQREKGTPPPEDVFGIVPYCKVVAKNPKH